jgi:hypothetical protein
MNQMGATATDASRSQKKQRCDNQAAPHAGIEQRLTPLICSIAMSISSIKGWVTTVRATVISGIRGNHHLWKHHSEVGDRERLPKQDAFFTNGFESEGNAV